MQNISVISSDTIRNHLANHSPSKIAHQFSKTKRFADPNPEYIPYLFRCPLAFYTY